MNTRQLIQSINCDKFWTLRRYTEKTTYLEIRNGVLQPVRTEIQDGIFVEVFTDNGYGYAGTDQINIHCISQAIEQATNIALRSSKLRLFDHVDMRPKVNQNYTSPHKKKISLTDIPSICDSLFKLDSILKNHDQIATSSAQLMIVQTDIHYADAQGSESIQEFSFASPELKSTAHKDGEYQLRSLGFPMSQQGLEVLDSINGKSLEQECERIREQALELIDAPNCPTGKMDLILNPDQMHLQIHESIGHPLELDRILGDERNYAGWSFVKQEDFGKLQYGSDKLNITFDPTLAGENASYAVDDTGVVASKEFLIKEGVLLRPLGGIESQIRANIEGTANARACSWNRPPLDRMANINLEPGDSTLDEMISGCEEGVLMSTNRTWSIDDFRNKFQFGCEYAKYIKDGVIKHTVKNPNYNAISTPFWNSLEKVGNRDSFQAWGSPYCGKAEPNQIIRVGHAAPFCLFSQVDIFGGHS